MWTSQKRNDAFGTTQSESDVGSGSIGSDLRSDESRSVTVSVPPRSSSISAMVCVDEIAYAAVAPGAMCSGPSSMRHVSGWKLTD